MMRTERIATHDVKLLAHEAQASDWDSAPATGTGGWPTQALSTDSSDAPYVTPGMYSLLEMSLPAAACKRRQQTQSRHARTRD
jgi:hypothetical protein